MTQPMPDGSVADQDEGALDVARSTSEKRRARRAAIRARHRLASALVVLAIVATATGCLPETVSRVPTTDPVVFFTIDDGIVRDPAVLDFLRTNDIPVTLFVNPGQVAQDPGYFQSFRDLGDSIQDHTVNHPSLNRLSVGDQQAEICGPIGDYAGRFGQTPWMLRPPYGNYDLGTRVAAQACGIRYLVLWRVVADQGRITTWGGPIEAGDIIIFHFDSQLLSNLTLAWYVTALRGLHPARLEDYLPSS